jgi:hypothetical protein
MTPNVGGMDRTLRIVVGLALLSLFFLLEGNARYWGLIGIVPILTGTFRWCPAYLPFGINTCPAKTGEGWGASAVRGAGFRLTPSDP